MACRLLNLHATQALRVDLRGGQALTLAPGARSAALRDEWLYDNHHLAEWERAGWLHRLPARLAEVGAPAAGDGPAASAAASVSASPSTSPSASRLASPSASPSALPSALPAAAPPPTTADAASPAATGARRAPAPSKTPARKGARR